MKFAIELLTALVAVALLWLAMRAWLGAGQPEIPKPEPEPEPHTYAVGGGHVVTRDKEFAERLNRWLGGE